MGTEPRTKAGAAELRLALTPWHRVPGDDVLEQGVLRRCLVIGCLGSSAIVPDTTYDAPVEHRDTCPLADPTPSDESTA